MTRTNQPTDSVGFRPPLEHVNQWLVERFTAAGFGEVRASYGSVLVPLLEQDGLRVGQLAAASRLSKQAMTGLVARCEADGLLTRERDPLDGRAFNVRLTARGREFSELATAVLAELDDQLVRSLGTRNNDALVRALKGVLNL